MQATNIISLILIIIVLSYFINEKKKDTKIKNNNIKNQKLKDHFFNTHSKRKMLESSLFKELKDNKLQVYDPDTITSRDLKDPYLNNIFTFQEKIFLDQQKKNKEVTSTYANQYCKNVNAIYSKKDKEDEDKITKEELDKIEERIFSKNIDKIHHQLHHDKHIKHSHNNDNDNNNNNDKLSSGNLEELVRKYNMVTRKTY